MVGQKVTVDLHNNNLNWYPGVVQETSPEGIYIHVKQTRYFFTPDKYHRIKPSVLRLFVNGRQKVTFKEDVSYADVVELASHNSDSPYTVTYQRAADNKEGVLSKEQTVKVKDGTVFNVADTSAA